MSQVFQEISEALTKIRWDITGQPTVPRRVQLDHLRKEWWREKWWREHVRKNPLDKQKRCLREVASKLAEMIEDSWPLSERLKYMSTLEDGPPSRWVGPHVVAVIASLNSMLPPARPANFFVSTNDPEYDDPARFLAEQAYHECWGDVKVPPDHAPFFGSMVQLEFAEGFLRIAALYHDIGKTISDEKHVSRGVHVLVDVNSRDRRAIEGLFEDPWDSKCLLALLKHHDVYGCLCTGEASLAALADMIGWTSPIEADLASGRSALAQISFLNSLNMADSDASLLQYLGGVTTVEAFRYLQDWKLVAEFVGRRPRSGLPIKRDEFTEWALCEASRADKTIERITRLVASCFRKETGSIGQSRERKIQVLVEQELQALHGPRFQRFCRRFARFAKLDYALRFFYKLMENALTEQGLRPGQRRVADEDNVREALRRMVSWTCAILDRIVEEYGHLVDGDHQVGLRLGVDMSKLMMPAATGQAICDSLKSAAGAAGGQRWIIDEISIWLYGE